MDIAGFSIDNWLVPMLAVGLLGVLTIVFALLIGRWIDTQSNSVVDEPRKRDQKSEIRNQKD